MSLEAAQNVSKHSLKRSRSQGKKQGMVRVELVRPPIVRLLLHPGEFVEPPATTPKVTFFPLLAAPFWMTTISLADFTGDVQSTWLLVVEMLYIYSRMISTSQVKLTLAVCIAREGNHLSLKWCQHLYADANIYTIPSTDCRSQDFL